MSGVDSLGCAVGGAAAQLWPVIQLFSGSAGGGPGKSGPRPHVYRMSFGIT